MDIINIQDVGIISKSRNKLILSDKIRGGIDFESYKSLYYDNTSQFTVIPRNMDLKRLTKPRTRIWYNRETVINPQSYSLSHHKFIVSTLREYIPNDRNVLFAFGEKYGQMYKDWLLYNHKLLIGYIMITMKPTKTHNNYPHDLEEIMIDNNVLREYYKTQLSNNSYRNLSHVRFGISEIDTGGGKYNNRMVDKRYWNISVDIATRTIYDNLIYKYIHKSYYSFNIESTICAALNNDFKSSNVNYIDKDSICYDENNNIFKPVFNFYNLSIFGNAFIFDYTKQSIIDINRIMMKYNASVL